ncbi:MAG: AMIN domain-containing protein [Sphingomonadales bacterium]|nr:AMIN domain-containing protein [Sphingomonadales bacterium]
MPLFWRHLPCPGGCRHSSSHRPPPPKRSGRPTNHPPQKSRPPRTRFIINLERHVDFEVSALTQPNRVLVDLPDVKVVLPDPLGDTPVGLIKSFRHGVSAPGKSRVVIDVTGPVVVEQADIEKGPDADLPNLPSTSCPRPKQLPRWRHGRPCARAPSISS